MSKAIQSLLVLAKKAGGTGEFSLWSKSDVWWFEMAMPDDVRAAGTANDQLSYFSSDATPHDSAEEGFIDDKASLAIAFERPND